MLAAWLCRCRVRTRSREVPSPALGSFPGESEVVVPFKSKAQEKWAFATKQKFAKEWADKTDQKKLPARAKKKGKK